MADPAVPVARQALDSTPPAEHDHMRAEHDHMRAEHDHLRAEHDHMRAEHDERLTVPLWWWAAGLLPTVILAAEVHMGSPGVQAWLPYVVLVPLVVWVIVRYGRLRVQVADGELRVGQAHLPLTVVSRVAEVPPSAKRSALGRQLDPAAFVQHRSFVPSMVLVVLDDPEDPTPYWLVSTRHPARLAAALRAGGAGAQR